MNRSRASTSSSQDQSLQNPFASEVDHRGYDQRSGSSPSPAAVPDSPSAASQGFPFHTHTSSQGFAHSQSSGSLHQRRTNSGAGVPPSASPMSRPGTANTHLSASQSNGDVLTFAPRANRDPPPASFMGPPRIGSMASRDSAFAAPPIRQTTPSINDPYRQKPVKAVPFKSTALVRDTDGKATIEKPWLEKKDPYIRISYFITWSLFLLLGFGGSALAIFFSWRAFPKIPNYCLVLEDNFDTLDLTNTWNREVSLGGFGNHEFEMTTNSDSNTYIKDGKLYITPTLTEDSIGGSDNLFSGNAYNLTDCTIQILDDHNNTIIDPDSCGIVPNRTEGVMIPPIMSGRINTKGKYNITYGKVTVRAKLPKGDWLWPAIWMLPEEFAYGPWPLSGEIDIMEARGNDKKYPAQGIDYVRGSLNWGPTEFMNAVWRTYGWWFERRKSFDQGFHDYTLEWTPDFLWVYVDSRLHRSLDLTFNQPFFDRGKFDRVVTNYTTGQQTVLQNPWAGRSNSAPFDRPFYLIMNVAVGGTNGWFPDGAGNKPWLDGSKTAMMDFYGKKDDWYSTWGDQESRSMVVDSVKMYKMC